MLTNKYLKIYEYNKISLDKIKFCDDIKLNVFSGKIIVFRNVKQIKEIIGCVKKQLKENLKVLKNFKDFNRIFRYVQNEIKSSKEIKSLFSDFLLHIRFELDKTFSDKICARFIYGERKNLGNLKFIKAHRDTWASYLFEQINWWFPIEELNKENTLFICPDFFLKKVKNDSDTWTYKKYLNNKKNFPSSPTSTRNFNRSEKILIKISPGDIICFSGHHIHGSNPGKGNRLTMETRTICIDDKKKFILPKNLDGTFQRKKTIWFKNIVNDDCLSKVYSY